MKSNIKSDKIPNQPNFTFNSYEIQVNPTHLSSLNSQKINSHQKYIEIGNDGPRIKLLMKRCQLQSVSTNSTLSYTSYKNVSKIDGEDVEASKEFIPYYQDLICQHIRNHGDIQSSVGMVYF